MMQIIIFNKPFNVLSQFLDENNRVTLKDFLPNYPGFYPAGRLDFDSEGLILLTNNGALQHHISDPEHKLPKTYWVQVEGLITNDAIRELCNGVMLKDGKTRPALARIIETPEIWERVPPIRERKHIPVSWISLTIQEGKNRQVRRMTAGVGFPTLRLIRVAIGDWRINGLLPGQHQMLTIASDDPILNTMLARKKSSSSKKPINKNNNAGKKPAFSTTKGLVTKKPK